MFRTFYIAASLAGLLLGSSVASAAAASRAPDPSNIGFVLYTKSYAPGTLNARWMYANKYSGPGIATGGPKEGFAGNYHVRYFYDSGEFSDEYDLVIEKTGGFYPVNTVVNSLSGPDISLLIGSGSVAVVYSALG